MMTRGLVIVALVVGVAAGCQYSGRQVEGDPDGPGGGDDDGPGAPPDARIDAMPGDPCNDWGFTPSEFDPCAIPAPTGGQLSINANTWTLDGNSGELVMGGTHIPLAHTTLNNITIFSVDHLEVLAPGILRVVGDDPVVIASWTDATISGTIDVSSDYNDHGAGANSPSCPGSGNGPRTGGNQSNGDGGSGGGGFNGDGGNGSDGNGGSGTGDGGNGGDGRGLPARIEGGCAGAPAQSGTSGYAGAGGGAIAIIAKGTLVVTGVITAGGDGGGGATGGGQEAGGGGGSGGMIKLEAQSLTVMTTATLAANGGQGGGGNNNNDASPGVDGLASATAADSDNKEGGGGRGGIGGALADVGGHSATPDPSNDGGGGGGGAAGYIVYRGYTLQSVDGGATISPAGQAF